MSVCPVDQGTATDLNGDGRPDVYVVKQAGNLVCRALDLNGDGLVDVVELHDEAGAVVAKLSDLDADAHTDEMRRYRNGKLISVERDLDGDGVIDSSK